MVRTSGEGAGRIPQSHCVGLSRTSGFNPDNATATGHLALYYARMGDVKEGLVLIHRARALDHSNVRLIYNEAAIQALAGNFHQALDCLREAFEKGYPPSGAKVDPELNGVRGQTEFQHLVAAFSKQRSR